MFRYHCSKNEKDQNHISSFALDIIKTPETMAQHKNLKCTKLDQRKLTVS